MKIFLSHLLVFFLFIVVVSCEKTGTEESVAFKPQPILAGDVNFKTVKEFVLEPLCLRCHEWAGDESKVVSRITPGIPRFSKLYQSVANGSMPEGGPTLTRNQLKIVADYIKALGRVAPIPVIALGPNYKSMEFHLFEKSCTMCHNGEKKSPYPNLTLEEEIAQSIDEIELQIDSGLMPPLDDNGIPRAPIPDEKVYQTFKKWIELGLP